MASIGVRIQQNPMDSGTGLGSLLAGFLTDPNAEAQLARARLEEQRTQSQVAQDAIENQRIQADRERLLADKTRIDAETGKISAERAQTEQQSSTARMYGSSLGRVFDTAMPAVSTTTDAYPAIVSPSDYATTRAMPQPTAEPAVVPRDQGAIDSDLAHRQAMHDLYVSGGTNIFTKGGSADDFNKMLGGVEFQAAPTDELRRRSLALMGDVPTNTTDLTGGGAAATSNDNMAKAEAALGARHEALDSRKLYFNARNAWDTMVSSAPDDTGASSIPFLYGVAQIMDPNSIVRDSEGRAVEVRAGGGISQQLANELNAMLRGQSPIDSKAKYRLLRMARPKVLALEKQYANDRAPMEATVRGFGYDPTRVLPAWTPLGEPTDWEKKMSLMLDD